MKNIVLFFITSLFFLCFSLGSNNVINLNSACAQEDWKEEYATVCAKTQNAMTLSAADLKDYIERCDKLQDRINDLEGAQAETERKVYTKRLKMCRDLYDFALKYKDEKE